MANFSDIIGHEDIVKHFKSSIELGKVSHAYILNGEKGSGKKTLAGIVVKSGPMRHLQVLFTGRIG